MALTIKEMKLSFFQVECHGDLLSALDAPAIPFKFLLSGPGYLEYLDRPMLQNRRCPPASWMWPNYGSNFWRYYTHTALPSHKELWRALVPLNFKFEGKITADWLNGGIVAIPYLYPWGIALMVDVTA